MQKPGFFQRLRRHVRLTALARGGRNAPSPPFVILFINSTCNLTCEHCFYWQNLNRRDDLTFEEIERLSRELGPIENLNLSGGEPFLRSDFAEIVTLFVRNNGAKQVYVPTNAYFPERTRSAIARVLEQPLQLFACEISLDGMPEYHDRFRGNPKSFAKAMETYDMLAELQKKDPRLRIHSISTATHENLDEIRRLTDHLHERCPAMDHHNIAIIRGDRKNPSLKGPALDRYRALWEHVRSRWADREEGRMGSIVEPLLQWTKLETLSSERQVVPCRAGVLSAVIYSNGDVSVCETHAPLGNLRKSSFQEIWHSTEARDLRDRIAHRECWCTNEVFMWPSIVFQPGALARASLGARIWKKPAPGPGAVRKAG
jgi:MoaA/NifB/PqqE/SkfB family radical SAM enzyme